MKAYKVFNENWICKDYDFNKSGNVIGSTHSLEGKLELCNNGFHFCRNLVNCFNYYAFNPSNKVAEIDVVGDIVGDLNDKECTNKLTIVRELEWAEVLKHCNSGNYNSGYCNSGDHNSGDHNSGDRNSGDRNSGYYNSGNYNSGYCNSGDRNSGDCNSGDRNSGDRNSGYCNSGDRNSGDHNSGDHNSGDRNSGYCNSGDHNSGDRNSGDRNSGDRNSGYYNSGNYNSGYYNSGDRNSGDRNSGYYNSGDYNSGNYNSGDCNSGYFNSKTPDSVFMFNKTWVKKSDISFPDWLYFNLTQWVSYDTATDEEREKHKEDIEVCGGFLKNLKYKEAFRRAWDNAEVSERKKVTVLPGFDKDVFFEISGIDVDKDMQK